MHPVATGVAETRQRLTRALKFALPIASIAAFLIGGASVANRFFGVEPLKTAASAFLTGAICFSLSVISLSLWWVFPESLFRRRLAQLCGLFVVIMGLLTISQHLIGWELGLEGPVKSPLREQSHTDSAWVLGRMSFNTALCFMLSGFALIRLRPRTRQRSRVAEWLSLTSGFVALTTIIGYLYGAREFVGLFSFSLTATFAAIALGILNLGLLAAQEGGGVIASFFSRGPEGILARQLALGGGVALLLLGFLTEWGEQAPHIQLQAQKAVLITTGIATITLLVWRAMAAIARLDVTRSKAEEALRQSEERYRAVSELTSDYIYEYSVAPDGLMVLREATASFVRITGFTPEEWEKQGGWKNHIHPDDLPGEESRWRRLLAGEADVSEWRIITRDGGVRWLRDYGRPVRDEATGRVSRIIGAVEDISERKRAEEALRESEERLKLTQAAGGIGGWDWNPVNGETFWSDITWRIYGYEPSADLKTPNKFWESLLYSEDRARVKQTLSRFLKSSDRDYRDEFRIVRPDGTVRWVESVGRLERNSAGVPARMSGVNVDVTARRSAEVALRESEERLRLAAQAADFGTYDFNIVANEGFWSPEVKVIFGLPETSENSFSMRQVSRALHPEDRERVIQAIRASVDPRGSGDFVDEHRILRPQGDMVWVMVKGKTFFTGSGNNRRALRATGTVLDITVRKRAEAERERLYEQERAARAEAERMRAVAEAANRSKDEFLTMVSHELRSPLNAVLGYTRLLRSGPADSDFVAHAASVVERNAKAQLQIVEDLLDSARIITGKLRLDPRPTDLVPVLEAALEVVRPAAESKAVELFSNFSPIPEQVLGDSDRLRQIVWNLLSNAVKFTPEGGRVEVTMETDADRVRISVSDNGAGIEPEFMPYVFDRFRQGDTSVTRRFGGLGLGLSLVKQLTEMHGGTIEVVSEGPSRGSTFTITLPRLAANATIPAQEKFRATPSSEVRTENAIPLEEAPSLEGMLVLIVDDQEEARALLTVALNECGAQVMAVSSGVEALAILADPPGGVQPDALILDIAMPNEDGYSVLQKVRAQEAERGLPPAKRIPAIALTAFGRSEDRMRALAAGFRMHVAKPVEPVELAIVIASLTNGIRR
jgi:PAS domain S-box-containing protein